MIAPPSEVGVEEIVANSVLWLKLFIEAIGALVIGVGMIPAHGTGLHRPSAQDRAARRLSDALREAGFSQAKYLTQVNAGRGGG